MRRTEPLAAFLVLCATASPAAAQSMAFDIPAGRLDAALIALAEQAGITIGASDPALAAIHARALRGRMPIRAALAALLDGTGYDFRFAGARTVRIVRAGPRPRPAPAPRPPALPVEPVTASTDIIVTASKQGVALERFAGTARMIALDDRDMGRFGARGSDAALERLPMLASTSLGPGRDKIFIRGISDSSFNGASQSITGQYLGDVRLTYNAPNPDLDLHDIERVELLEGPQGTLYGTGSLGGILRFVPRAPDASGIAGAVTGGLLATRHGNPGGDFSAMLNLPIATDRLALRAVGYGAVDGGYIDDIGTGRRNVNRSTTYGGRASLAWLPGNGWSLELGGVAQYLAGRDGQYADRGLQPLTRRSALPQPYDNDYQLGHFTVRKRWSGLEFVSATAISRNSLESRFDATGFPGTTGPQRFVENMDITLLSNETRISQPDTRGAGWVAGWSVLHNVSRITRHLGPPGALAPQTGVRNEVTEAALFGQASRHLTGNLVATLGGRLTWSRTMGEPLDSNGDADEPDRTDFRASPTVALSWRPADRLLVYARFQQGFRAGGLAVSATGAATSAQRFESDTLSAYEAGIRFGHASDPFTFNAALSYARWSDIQADLIDPRGLPFTTNIGDGRIYGFEFEAGWRPAPGLKLEGAVFVNESALSRPAPAFAAALERDLPNIAGTGGRAGMRYETALSPGVSLMLDASARYVGPSRLGIGAPIDIRQGNFTSVQTGARLDFGRFGISFDIDNLLDTRGNRFAFGNPFRVGDRTQTTPLRPRTMRLGLNVEF